MKRSHLFVIWGILICHLGGCGIQMPVTEGLVFTSSEPYGQKHEEVFSFLRYNGAVTAISTIPMYSQLEEAAIGEHGDDQAQQLNRKLMTAGGNPGFGVSFGNGQRFAMAFTPGLIFTGMHADATLRTFKDVYVTLNHHFAIQNATEVILQHPIYEKNGGGLSVGGFFRKQPMEFSGSDMQGFEGEPSFDIQWYGMRVMGQTPSAQGSNLHIRAFINAGYVRDYEIPMVAVGMAFSFD